LIEILGSCQKKFFPVRTVFEDNFNKNDEIGAGLCLYHKGIKVIDIWAGYKNLERKEPWTEDTMVPFFSVTKGLAALCILTLADKKKIDYDKSVSYYWKDFANKGKEKITVKDLLEHKAGLHALDKQLKIEDFYERSDKVYQALIDQRPRWRAGEKQAYGAQIWGAYIAELFYQITGESAGTFFNREISKKMGLNIFLGLPKEKESDVAKVYPVSNWDRIRLLFPHFLHGNDSEGRTVRAILKGNSEAGKAYTNPWTGSKGLNVFNDPELHAHELLWANGIGDARSLARIYNVFVLGGKDGKVKFANSSLLKQLSAKNELMYDEVIHKPIGWNLGFQKEEIGLLSPNEEAYGHMGMGGSLGFADPKAKFAFGYVCNKMNYRTRPDKTLSLCKAVYKCI
jgi:CubicO group peptidase (beta-lactamase class C family)